MKLSDVELLNWSASQFKELCLSVNAQHVILIDMDWKEINK